MVAEGTHRSRPLPGKSFWLLQAAVGAPGASGTSTATRSEVMPSWASGPPLPLLCSSGPQGCDHFLQLLISGLPLLPLITRPALQTIGHRSLDSVPSLSEIPNMASVFQTGLRPIQLAKRVANTGLASNMATTAILSPSALWLLAGSTTGRALCLPRGAAMPTAGPRLAWPWARTPRLQHLTSRALPGPETTPLTPMGQGTPREASLCCAASHLWLRAHCLHSYEGYLWDI